MRLITSYVFYADVFFVQNLLIKVTVLYLALYVNKQNLKVNPIKIVIAGVFGTALEICALVWGGNFSFFVGLVNLVEMPLVMLFLLGKEVRTWLNVTVSAWFFVLVVNGVIEAIWNYFGEIGHFLEFLILSCLVVGVGTNRFMQYQRIAKGIYPAILSHKDKSIHCRGFYDSGNRLKDPYTGVGVHIITGNLAVKLKLTEENMVFIPYTSLGNKQDLIQVHYIEKLTIYGRKEVVTQTNVAVGTAEEGLLDEKKYDLILNENVW